MLRQKQIMPISCSFRRVQRYDDRIPDDIIIDKVIHNLDLALYFFGSIESVRLNDVKKIGDKIFQADIEFCHINGVKVRSFVSWLIESDEKIRQVSIQCRKHMLFGDFLTKKLMLDSTELQCAVPGWILPANNQIKDELVDFILYCSEPAGEIIKPLLTIEDIIESAKWLENIVNQTKP